MCIRDRGSTVLGAAFEKRDRKDLAEGIYRLGLQFSRESSIAAELFFRLGRIYDAFERFPEAIAVFRRALALGVAEEKVLTYLGRAFLKSGKTLAALALLEHASGTGYLTAEFEADLHDARRILRRSHRTWSIPLTPGGVCNEPA